MNQENLEETNENLHYLNADFYVENMFSRSSKAIVSFSSERSTSTSNLMFEFPEAYYDNNFNQNSNLSVGRKLLHWSYLDESWQLGYVNMRKHFSVAAPSQVGLNIINYSYNFSPLTISLIGSYFYIPERYPSYEIKDGNLSLTSSSGREFWPKVLFESGKTHDIYFEKNQAELGDIVFKKTYGVNMEYEGNNNKINLFYMYKPENIYRVYGVTEVRHQDSYTSAKLGAEFFNHHVFGGDFRTSFLGLDLTTSSITVIPEENPSINIDYDTNNVLREERNKNAYVQFGVHKEFKKALFKCNYIKEISGSSEEKKKGILPTPLAWKDAFNFIFEGSFSNKWKSLFDLKISRQLNDSVLALETKYQLSKNFLLGLGLQVIYAEKNNSYWAPYRENDMAFSSLMYNF